MDASFQGPGEPEHIYVTIEELRDPSQRPPPHRGLMPWAQQRATDAWARDETPGGGVNLFRKTNARLVLIRLIASPRPTRKARAFLESLQRAADNCLAEQES